VKKKIIIILPLKESLDPKKAGAVSIYVKDSLKYSKYKNNIKVISSNNFSNSIFFRNKNYIIQFCKKYKDQNISILEIHNRPEYVKVVKKYFPNSKIILTFHNDPLNLRGSVLASEREYIIKNCEKIVFISKWIQKRFYTQISTNVKNNYELIYPGILKKKNINLSKKKKNILFVGKLNENKGYHIFHDVAKQFKKINPNWNFIAIGNEPRKKIFPEENIIKEVGYKEYKKVLDYYEKSEIAIGNSFWDEPFGRIAIEALACGVFIIMADTVGSSADLNENFLSKTFLNHDPGELYKLIEESVLNIAEIRKQRDLRINWVKENWTHEVSARGLMKTINFN